MANQNSGLLLARLARELALPVVKIAEYTGATRCTVYNWLSGKGISPAYRPKVQKLIVKLQRGTAK